MYNLGDRVLHDVTSGRSRDAKDHAVSWFLLGLWSRDTGGRGP